MKNERSRNILTLIVFGCMVMSLACGTDSRTDNRSVVSNADSADAPDGDRSSICPANASFQDKKTNITTYIENELTKLDKLKQQKGAGFDYEIIPVTPQQLLEIKVTGFVRGAGKQETTFEDFLDIIDGLMKKGCIDRVTFHQGISIQNELPRDGFEWQACEPPNVYCANGVCQQNCSNLDTNSANTGANTNSSNSNSNSNSNANSNSNSNSNRNN